MALNKGDVLQARYRIVSRLGQGGMGAVYRAWDTRLEVPVALKEMTPQPGLDDAALMQLRQQFRQEATVVAQLSHPQLVSVTDFFEEGGNAYLVMNFVAGESLSDLIQRVGALPEPQVLAWANALLDALTYCHSRGVIHRDIKPQNVIIQPNGQPVLVDFGLVKLWNPQDVRTRTAMRGLGTPEYAPPEQYDAGGHTDPRSDLYSLAATLYQALTGQAPPTATQRIVNPAVLLPVRHWNPQVSPALEAVLLRALELRPEARYQSAQEMRAALVMRPTPPVSPPPPPGTSPLCYVPQPVRPPAPSPQPASRLTWLWIGGLLLFLLLAVLVILGLAFKAFTAFKTTPVAVSLSPPPATGTSALVLTETSTPAVFPESTTPPVTVGASEEPTLAATATLQPTDTLFPTATSSPTSRPPTATNTPFPTLTPTPTPTLTPPCPTVTGAFAALWLTYQSRLGCALNQPHSPVLAQELFEAGQMFWREDTDRVLVLYASGRWASYADIWSEGDPQFSCPESAPSLSPPTPARGFGKIWCTYTEVRQQLGNATTAERGFYGGLVQDFDRGTFLRTDSGDTYILFGDGTWTR